MASNIEVTTLSGKIDERKQVVGGWEVWPQELLRDLPAFPILAHLGPHELVRSVFPKGSQAVHDSQEDCEEADDEAEGRQEADHEEEGDQEEGREEALNAFRRHNVVLRPAVCRPPTFMGSLRLRCLEPAGSASRP